MLNAKLAKGQRERIEQKKFRNNVEITHHHATIPTSTIKTNGSKKGSNAIINGGGTVAVPPDTTIRKSILVPYIYLYAPSKYRVFHMESYLNKLIVNTGPVELDVFL